MIVAALLALTLQLQTPPAVAVPVQEEPLAQPHITYPEDAKRRRIQGIVHLQIAVDAAGHVFGVKALDGPLPLRQAAIDAYSQASYPPLIKDGRPAPAIISTAVNFKLDELPPDNDQQVDKQFEVLHSNCQQLSLEKSADALETCRRAVDLSHRFSPGVHLEERATALNDLVLLLIATGKYDGTKSGRPNPDLPEASSLAEQAVDLVAGSTPHTPAVAIAFITRAEVRSLQGDLKGALADCSEAEEALMTTLQDDPENERAGRYRVQLRETLLLHAVVLEREHKKDEAQKYRNLSSQY